MHGGKGMLRDAREMDFNPSVKLHVLFGCYIAKHEYQFYFTIMYIYHPKIELYFPSLFSLGYFSRQFGIVSH